jgi:hypothetical protein
MGCHQMPTYANNSCWTAPFGQILVGSNSLSNSICRLQFVFISKSLNIITFADRINTYIFIGKAQLFTRLAIFKGILPLFC